MLRADVPAQQLDQRHTHAIPHPSTRAPNHESVPVTNKRTVMAHGHISERS